MVAFAPTQAPVFERTLVQQQPLFLSRMHAPSASRLGARAAATWAASHSAAVAIQRPGQQQESAETTFSTTVPSLPCSLPLGLTREHMHSASGRAQHAKLSGYGVGHRRRNNIICISSVFLKRTAYARRDSGSLPCFGRLGGVVEEYGGWSVTTARSRVLPSRLALRIREGRMAGVGVWSVECGFAGRDVCVSRGPGPVTGTAWVLGWMVVMVIRATTCYELERATC